MYPLPVASVHVVPEVGADARLNTNPEVTMVGLDPLDGVVVGVNDIVGVRVIDTLGVMLILGVLDTDGVIEGVIDGVTDALIVGVTDTGIHAVTLKIMPNALTCTSQPSNPP